MLHTWRWTQAVLVLASVCVSLSAAAQTPTARVADFSRSDGTFYIVDSIDGKEVPNALDRSRLASRGQGNRWRVVPFERDVPAGRVKLALRAVRADVMPAASIFRSAFMGGEPEIRGTADFELKPDQYYRVNGFLDDYRREVWLEDSMGQIVGSKVTLSADPATVKAMEGATFITTNLRYEGDWISNDPTIGLPIVPIGARMKVLEYRKDRAMVLVDGRKMRVGVDSQSGETIQQFVARITSTEDPRPKIAAWSDDLRAAVSAGRLFLGMTREQVTTVLGRPRPDWVRSLDQAEWSYRAQGDGSEVILVFDANGNLTLVDGSRKARSEIFLGIAPAVSMSSQLSAPLSAPAAASAPQ